MPYTTQFRGCTFSYTIQGEGEPVVFVQGVGLHGDGWRPQTSALRNRFRCLTFDNRGMAQSQPPATEITVEQMADDTLAIMNAANIASAHIVGHSLGGCVAQQIALSNPDRVKSLSLLCTSARGADATRLTLKMAWLGARSRIGTRQMRRLAFLQMVLSPQYLATCDQNKVAEDLAPIFGHDLADTPPIVMPQLGALKRFDVSSRLNELAAIPTLVLSAACDVIFPPRYGRALADAIPGAHFVEFPNAAHGVTIERADEVNAKLAQHIETSGSS